MKYILEAIQSMFTRLTAHTGFRKTGRPSLIIALAGVALVGGLVLLAGCPTSSSSGNGNAAPITVGGACTIGETACATGLTCTDGFCVSDSGPGGNTRSEQTDCPVTASTTCSATLGTAFTGELTAGDSDWIKVTLVAENSYRVELTSGSQTLAIRDTDGTAVDPALGTDSLYTPAAGGSHIVVVSGTTGEYSLNVVAAPLNGAACNILDNEGNCDSDSIANMDDVDAIGDNGLIEIATAAELHNVRWDLDGSHYDSTTTKADGTPETATSLDETDGSNMGCPSLSDGGCVGYELVADLDLATEAGGMYADWQPIGVASDNIGTSVGLQGIFEGNGHAIRGLNMRTKRTTFIRLGLFGVIEEASHVRNLHVAGIINNPATSSMNGIENMGLLSAVNAGTISNCSAAADITGNREINGIGGLVGQNDGTIENSWATGSVNGGGGGDSVGGLVGTFGTTSSGGMVIVRNSYAVVTVSNGITMGGLVGAATSDNMIENSWAGGTVTGSTGGSESIGGLIGQQAFINIGFGTSNSYATGAVVSGGGADRIGALIGNLGSNGGSVLSSYASGTVDGAVGVAIGNIGASPGTTSVMNVAALTPAQLQMATVVGGPINPAVDESNMAACMAGGGTFTAASCSDSAYTDQATCEINSGTWTPTTCADEETTVYVGWNTNNWQFGTTSELPSLRSYKESSGTQIQGDLLCGQPAPRATRAVCTDTTLLPLP